jgi:crossover junction endodeoxyribonuclease RuvC
VFSFGCSYGTVLGVLGALQVPTEQATPQRWKGTILSGTLRDKAAAVAFCRSRWPGTSLLASPRCRKPHDGIADALALAEYGRRIIVGNTAAKETSQ